MAFYDNTRIPTNLNSRAQLRLLKSRFTERLKQFVPHELRMMGPRRNYPVELDYWVARGNAVERAVRYAIQFHSRVEENLPTDDVRGAYSPEAIVWMQREFLRWVNSIHRSEMHTVFWSTTLFQFLWEVADTASLNVAPRALHLRLMRRSRSTSA